VENPPGGGLGTFSATVLVRPVFAFTNMQDLSSLTSGLITPDQVRVIILDTNQPGSPTNPLTISFGAQQSDWVRQACSPQIQEDGLFFFHNPGAGFIPGVHGNPPPGDPCQQFKPGPMKHVKPGEAHYIKPPNKNPGGAGVTRCSYNLLGQ